MSTAVTTDAQNVTTGKVRMSYVFLNQPRKDKDKPEDPGRYTADLIIPKKSVETVKRIKAGIAAAIEAGKTDKSCNFTDKTAKAESFWNPLRDGDAREDGDAAYADSYYLCAKSTKKVKVVDEDKNEILDADEIYSGMFGRANIRFYPFKNKTIGIGVQLNLVQKLADGERLGGGYVDPEKAFGEDVIDDDDL